MNRKALLGKGTSILLALVLLLCVALPVLGGGADPVFTDAVFTVGTASAGAGDEGVEVSVYVEDCPLFVGLGLQFTYDTSALTLTEIARGHVIEHPQIGTLTSNPGDGILYFDWSEAAFDDGEVFVLKFNVSEEAVTNDYPIGIDLSSAGWANDDKERLTGTFVPGEISVDGIDGVALYNGLQYPTLHAAIDAAALSGEPGTVKLLDDITIEVFSDRIIIPDGVVITLDMNGKTITSKITGASQKLSCLVDVEQGGVLDLVDRSAAKGGGFYHETGSDNSTFLINRGVLDMDNIIVENFHVGLYDGSRLEAEKAGNYGIISDCTFKTAGPLAMNLYHAVVNTITRCVIETSAGGISIGEYGGAPGAGEIVLIEDCEFSCPGSMVPLIQVYHSAEIGTIRNCTAYNVGEPYEWEGYVYIDGYAIDVNGHIGTIDGGVYETGGLALNVYPSGTIGTISESTFISASGSAVRNDGAIDYITGGTFGGELDSGESTYGLNVFAGGTVQKISGGKFKGTNAGLIVNQSTVVEISGGKFSSHYYGVWNHQGEIESITGGEFGDQTTNYGLRNNDEIGDISGGDFIGKYSGLSNVAGSAIDSITGGKFIGMEWHGLRNIGGTIGSISDSSSAIGPMFKGGADKDGDYSAILNEVSGEGDDAVEPAISSLAGGYYKTGHEDLIDGFEYCTVVEGYDFSTVPLQEAVVGEAGYYHFGETVDITWDIEGETETDKFVIGDPIYYAHDTPTSDAGVFRGWSDGENEYGQEAELPLAAAATTYEALFAPPAEDYLVTLEAGRDNINAGEVFTVDVVITSEYNENFYGATVEVDYESDKVDYKSVVLPDGFGLVEDGNVLKIVGASGSELGYEMDEDNSFVLAKLTFQANSNVSTGEAVFSIGDRPVVNQEDAVYDQIVPKGDDLTLSLWNLQVTFKAGDNVTMTQEVAYVKYDEAGLWTDTSYTTAFDEPSPAPYAHHTLDDPLWKPVSGDNVDFETIEATSYTVGAIYTANASPSQYDIEYPESVEIVSGVEKDKVTYLTPVLFTVTPDSGYRVNRVSYTVGIGEPEVIEAVEGTYTIPGNKVTGDIVINVEQVVSGTVTFISNDDFRALPTGYKVLLLTVKHKLMVGAYEYDGNAMFYSSKYSEGGDHVYVYVVADNVDENVALEKLAISDSGICQELAYDGNVNLDEGLNSTDVVLIYGLYKEIHKNDLDFTKVTMRMRLEADVNGDQVVDTQDAQIVLNNIWGNN